MTFRPVHFARGFAGGIIPQHIRLFVFGRPLYKRVPHFDFGALLLVRLRRIPR